MKGKSGWIRILEATIAVMIVSGAMIAVYSNQSVREEVTISDYSYSLQKEILADIALRTDLRLDVLSVVDDSPGDPSYDKLNAFVKEKIPDVFGYSLRICDLGNLTDFCKMDSKIFIVTLDKDVYVEEIVISSEVGGGPDAVYSPKKVRLFFWEGELPSGFCVDECSAAGLLVDCSADGVKVLGQNCVEDVDGCLNWGVGSVIDDCSSRGKICVGGECVDSLYKEGVCRGDGPVLKGGCVSSFDDECDAYDHGRSTGGCGFFKERYECWNDVYEITSCKMASPDCSLWPGYVLDSTRSCVGASCYDTCSSLGFECGTQTICGASVNCSVCSSGKVCSNGKCVVGTSGVAVLSASYSGLSYNAYDSRWYYNLIISETGGVSVTLSHRQRCWLYFDGCEAFVYDSVAKFGTGTILANGQVSASDRWFFTSRSPQQMTETWYGVDANGHPVQVSYSINVP